MSSIDRVYEILETKNLISKKEQIIPDEKLKGNVCFKNVSFSYDEKKVVLKNITLDIKSNTLNSIVGKSGAGKTTLCLLLGRFFDVESGSIEIDGYDIRQLNGEWYRKNVGIVLQNCFLFSGTIRENILLGNNDATEDEIKQAAMLANAHQFIEKLPDGYWTQVGDSGRKLSGGQAQRIAIARIFLQNPSIVILDEATSFIDLESEMYIKEALQKLAERATVIIITHKLETAKNSSNIIVVNDGTIVQQGLHDQLIREETGVYNNLYKKVLN